MTLTKEKYGIYSVFHFVTALAILPADKSGATACNHSIEDPHVPINMLTTRMKIMSPKDDIFHMFLSFLAHLL